MTGVVRRNNIGAPIPVIRPRRLPRLPRCLDCREAREKGMGRLSTHVLDTAHGCPAAGMRVILQKVAADGEVQTVRDLTLDADGRNASGPLLDGATMSVGRWRLLFDVASYFRARGVALPDPPFIETARIDFGIADAAGHYHVPLLVSPWSWSTYRGS
jgi:5-hydroxyisourate hydrolase